MFYYSANVIVYVNLSAIKRKNKEMKIVKMLSQNVDVYLTHSKSV